MENKNEKLFLISDVVKKLGISFEELKSEFNECGIRIRKDDKVTGETLKHVLSGMFDGEYDWGNHLHLETGEVKGDIDWKGMRGNEGDEITTHGTNIQGWAQKLGVDAEILENELKVHGYMIGKDQKLTLEQVQSVINGIELHSARDDLKVEHTEGHAHCLGNDCGTYNVSEMATNLGVPAVTLVSWLSYTNRDVYTGSKYTESTIVGTMKEGKLDWSDSSINEVVYGVDTCSTDSCKTKSVSPSTSSVVAAGAVGAAASYLVGSTAKADTCSTGACSTVESTHTANNTYEVVKDTAGVSVDQQEMEEKETSKSLIYAAGNGSDDIPEGIVAMGEPAKMGVFKNMHTGLARGLLGFLAVPLLAGLFLDGKGNLEDISAKAGIPIEFSVVNQLDHAAAEVIGDAVSEKGEVVMKNPGTVLPTRGVADTEVKNMDVGMEDVAVDADADPTKDMADIAIKENIDSKAATKNFIDGLVKDMQDGMPEAEHGVALPTRLPQTGVQK